MSSVNAWLVTFGGLYATTMTHFVLFSWSSSVTDSVLFVSSVLICRHGISVLVSVLSEKPETCAVSQLTLNV